MANRLSMEKVGAIRALLGRGWPHRKIARELGIHRETVARYASLPGTEESDDPDRSPDRASDSKPAKVTTGSEVGPRGKPAKVTAGSRSLCEPFSAVILEKLEAGLTAQRIYQDLSTESDFDGGYESVKRFCRRLRSTTPLPFRRMEVSPGEEAQVDFGKGAFVRTKNGRRRRPHLFRVVLSHSRKAYSEVVWTQSAESFLRSLENAFRYFGGVPATVVPDNLKAAVVEADWYDPKIHPKLRSFAEHYGFVILPTKPYTPRHKGKVEAGVGYVQDNALKGRTFESLEEQNRFLRDWEHQVADTRIHGTTRRQVREHFESAEKPRLKPLPTDTFPCFEEAERKVHRDGHVAIQNAFYSVPPEYLGCTVWARWDLRLVRIFNHRFEQIAIHPRRGPGTFQTHPGHIHPHKISAIEKGAEYLLGRIATVGEYSESWSQAVLKHRGIAALRTLQGFLQLVEKHKERDLERVCRIALQHDAHALRHIRRLLRAENPPEQQSFLEEHPVIRDLAVYDTFVRDALTGKETQ